MLLFRTAFVVRIGILSTALLANALLATRLGAQDASPPSADEGAPEKPAADPKAKARQEFVLRAARRFELVAGPERTVSKLRPEPLLVWSNPVSGTRSGILVMFSRNGRPDVIAQFSYPGSTMMHEFHACEAGVTLSRDGTALWTPESATSRWSTLENVEPPAATPALRLVQMRRIAAKFVVKDNFGWTTKELHTLRPLSQPVHRYGKEGEEVRDGAVFVYALATDPEAALMLECHNTEQGLVWKYAFAPVSIYALTASLDDKVVWEVPERRIFGNANAVQFVGPYRLDPGETAPE